MSASPIMHTHKFSWSALVRAGLRPSVAAAALTASLLLVMVLLFDTLRASVRDEVNARLLTIAQVKADQLQQWLAGRRAAVQALGGDAHFSAAVEVLMQRRDEVAKARLWRTLETYRSAWGFASIQLLDAQGTQWVEAGTLVKTRDLALERAWGGASSGVQWVDLHDHPGELLLLGMGWLVPLTQHGKQFAFLYLAEEPTQHLFPLLQTWPDISHATEIELVRSEATGVRYIAPLREARNMLFQMATQESAAVQALQAGKGETVQVRDYRGKPVLASAVAVPGTAWHVVAKVDGREAYRLLGQLERVTWVVVAALLMLVFSWFWQWRRREQAAAESRAMHPVAGGGGAGGQCRAIEDRLGCSPGRSLGMATAAGGNRVVAGMLCHAGIRARGLPRQRAGLA